jgi:hypothetical protein
MTLPAKKQKQPMTFAALKLKLNSLEEQYERKKHNLQREYCDANNPYKIGDNFTDHIGTIKIERIAYYFSSYGYEPSCIYFGIELKKDGTPKASEKRRKAFQPDDKKQQL